jgi:uncharacterized protein GlcG (DUF336 family)
MAAGITADENFKMRQQLQLDHQDARLIVDACARESLAIDIAVSIAVLDAGGAVLELSRLDGASFQTPDVARGKALTAVMMRKSSKAVEEAVLSRPTLIAFDDGRLPIQGGLPILVDGVCIGAVAVSGGSPDQDESIASVGLNAFLATLATIE